MGRRVAGICAAALVASGCEAGDAPVGFEVRDSAGVRIVINDRSAPEAGGRIMVDTEPALSIGTLDGPEEQQLFRVVDATQLPDGTIVVLNSGTSELRFYDAEGAHLRSAGSNGEGPGEYRVPRWVLRHADTLVVFDGAQENGRATYLTLTGELIKTQGLSTEHRRFPNPVTVLPDGSFLDAVDEGSIPSDEMGHVRYTVMPVRYPPSATPVDTITAVPGTEMLRSAFLTAVVQTSVPFGREAQMAAGHDRLFLGNGDVGAIEAFDFSGTHLMSIRFPEEQPSVTSELVERWIATRLDAPTYRDNPEEARQSREYYEAPPVPATMPAHRELIVDAGQRLWVRRYAPPWESSHDYMVFDTDGVWLGDASLPLDLRVFEIGEDYILGVARDALEVEYLRKYRWSIADG